MALCDWIKVGGCIALVERVGQDRYTILYLTLAWDRMGISLSI